jgi:hypothetical protein
MFNGNDTLNSTGLMKAINQNREKCLEEKNEVDVEEEGEEMMEELDEESEEMTPNALINGITANL